MTQKKLKFCNRHYLMVITKHANFTASIFFVIKDYFFISRFVKHEDYRNLIITYHDIGFPLSFS